ncbi:MAG: cryptochrome/photolyase family protein [Proteobacteria bacterium]|jgi:deoxyribodipyrimidine photolyase-related protein|uniref:Deoxyribodipyrimidine photolyase n=1 Tax=SAR92 bacterium BACL26 MAG-121220-bin70 TaxID=1655626 RepID=A0A0R2UCQ3_9GAMM|nr:MAG: deoxyribodipyrimidine photolyase [SAR92 bacterium BACL26 MAG-121220-bin70]MDA0797004.1 cryptochrome/photolyase family protein [Pseudomonadota bacterium]MDA1350668.1 cryptochrome/photolyase family protein [Pseudomonadota bacterium]
MSKSTLLVLGNQLFSLDIIQSIGADNIFMAEDLGLCTYEKHHKLKILMFLAAMREKRDELQLSHCNVEYLDMEHPAFDQSYEEKLAAHLVVNTITELKVFEIEDKEFEARIEAFAEQQNVALTILPSPMFLLDREEFLAFNGKSKVLRMGNFYKEVRKKLNLLMDEQQKPLGGKWSFDEDNRKKIPKGLTLPEQFKPKVSKYVETLKVTIESKFSGHPGKMDDVWMPLTRSDALENIDYFLAIKFEKFGIYEDAILQNDTFMFHSALSPSLNMGLITPIDIIDKVLAYTETHNVPVNSVEGFLRQIIGWREFIRGVYQHHGETQLRSNFFNFSGSLKDSWYSGNTGIPPLDDAINFSDRYGYTHHINRLMVISNLMTLCEVHPKNVYRWFMEMYVDSSEWVMTPNVFGMGTFADGGIFATKPYICGSNYILKMSDYKKGEWCNTVDGLYWRFVSRHMGVLRNNPRLSFMRQTLEKMDPQRKQLIFSCAEDFTSNHCAYKCN